MPDFTEKFIKILEETEALLEGHFLLSSGLHSDKYVQCAKLLQYPAVAETTGIDLAGQIKYSGLYMPDFIASPAIGGIVIGQEVAKALGIRHNFIEKDSEGKPILRRGFNIKPGEKFIVVEDVVTTGKSTHEVLDTAKKMGAEPVAVLSIINRTGSKKSPFGIPFEYLVKLELNTYNPKNCPLCSEGIPLIKPGSRKAGS